MNISKEQYLEWLKNPLWTILNDPHTHDCENSKGEFYYIDNLYARTPYGIIFVPAKERVNGASIHWSCQWLIPKSGKWNRPSAFHDSGYLHGGFYVLRNDANNNIIQHFIQLSQKQVDTAYLELMKKRKVSKWKRKAQYRALRMFGWFTWNKYRK